MGKGRNKLEKEQKDGDKKSDGGNDTFLGKHFYVVWTFGTMSVFYIVEKVDT